MLIFLETLTLKRENAIIAMSEGEISHPHRPSSAPVGQERRKPHEEVRRHRPPPLAVQSQAEPHLRGKGGVHPRG